MYKTKQFDNGVRLITAPLSETKTATLLALVKTGSRCESVDNNGVSHFIEHMMFKGTKKRPTALDLTKALDGVGAEFNAFTGKDYTGYYVKADTKHLDLAIDVLSDMLLNSKFETKEINREKKVIIEEINMYEDNPVMYVEDLLEQTMFDKKPLGYFIAGRRESVFHLDRSKLVSYRDQYYTGPQTVITLAGKFADSHISQIEKKFKFSHSGQPTTFDKYKFNQKKPQVKIKYKDTEQTQIALGFPAYAYTNKKIYPLTVLSVILGGNMSSRLFMNVREKKGWAYFVHSDLNIYEDIGSLVIQAGLDKLRLEQALSLIVCELQKIIKGVTGEELTRAKEYLAGRTALSLEDTSRLAQWYGKQELLTNQILTPERKIKKIMAVTGSQVKQVAKEVINFNKASLAIIGPYTNRQPFRDILKVK